jgi:hypothetical protein
MPLFSEDRVYCCAACASRHLCTCLQDVDLADDGVDGLGLLFALETPDRSDLVRTGGS